MLLVEEKASWLLELTQNPLFSRGNSDVDLVFELDDWTLILTEEGGHLIYLPISDQWYTYIESYRVFSVLEKLPDTKKEFYSMLEQIKEEGRFIKDPTECPYLVYIRFTNRTAFNYDIVEILKLKDFDLKDALNERERFKFAVKKELNEGLNPRFKVIFLSSFVLLLVISIILYLIDLLKLFNGLIEELSKMLTTYNTIIFSLFYFVFFYLIYLTVSMFYKKRKINFILKSVDELGVDFFNFSTVNKKDFLSKEHKLNRNIVIDINYTEKVLSDSKINFIN
jgi:hypothetical protein